MICKNRDHDDSNPEIKVSKDIMYSMNHPFHMGIDFVFQTEFKTHFMMQHHKGELLSTHLKNVKKVNEKEAKFIAA